MRVEIKLTKGQENVLSQLNATFEQAKKELDNAIGIIVLGKVNKGQMKEIKDSVLVIEAEPEDIISEEAIPPKATEIPDPER